MLATVSGSFPNVSSETDVALFPSNVFTAAPSAGAAVPDQVNAVAVVSSPDGSYSFLNVPQGEYWAVTTDNTGTSQFNRHYGQEEPRRIPQYATASLPALGTNDAGSLVYDTTANKLKLWIGGAWQTVTSA